MNRGRSSQLRAIITFYARTYFLTVKMLFPIFLLLISIKRSEQIVSFDEGSSDRGEVSSCVNRVVKYHFGSENQVTILNQGSKDYVKGIESTVRLIGNISKLDKMWRLPQTKQAVVFLDGGYRCHRDNLNALISLENFHPLARFLIVFSSFADSELAEKNYLTNVVRHLHKNQRWEVALAVESIDGDVRLYGYTKTAPENCDKPEILSFGRCSSEKIVSRLFTNDVNYNRCPLRLATFDWPPFARFVIENGRKKSIGIESALVNIIVERLNATQFYITADPSEIRKIIGNGDADIGYGQMALYDNNEYLYTKSWCSVQGLVLIPKYSSILRSALDNFMPLRSTVWLAIIIVVVFVTILRCVLPVFKAIPTLETFAMLLGHGANVRPMRLSQRTYLISWIIFGFIITQAYLANLTMIFAKANDQGEIRSLEELEKSNIAFGGSTLSAKFFKNKFPRLYGEYEDMGLSEFKENLMKLKTGSGGLATYVEVSKYISYDHWKRAVTLPEIITSYPVAIILPNSSTILRTCDRTITLILEAGLIDQWSDFENRKKLSDDATEDDDHLNLDRFLGVFLFLGIALAFSFVVFIIELLAGFFGEKIAPIMYGLGYKRIC